MRTHILDPKNLYHWKKTPGERSLEFSLKRLRRHNPNACILDYQRDNLDRALALVKSNRRALDGGANFGIMSWHLSQCFDKVVAWEIDPDIRHCLITNMNNFGCNNVQVEDCGLGKQQAQVSLVRHAKTFANYVDPDQIGDFTIRAIDSYNYDDVDFIKLDCEGYEALIIEGAQHTIQKCRPVILMEQKVLSKRYGHGVYHAQGILSQWGYQVAESLVKDVIMISK